MARPPRWKYRTARCENGHEFRVKQELVEHRINLPGGAMQTMWVPGKVEEIVQCPKCPSTRFELVEE